MTTVSNVIMSEVGERYARALLDLAQQAGELKSVQADVDALGAIFSESADLAETLSSPLHGEAEKAAVLSALTDRLGARDLTCKFIAVAVKNGRAGDISAMLGAFSVLTERMRGAVSARVITADALAPAQHKDLAAALKSALDLDVDIHTEVRPDILGGLIVRVGSRMFDSSLHTKLEGLRNTMKEA